MMHPANLALRFILEIAALGGFGAPHRDHAEPRHHGQNAIDADLDRLLFKAQRFAALINENRRALFGRLGAQ